jgi:hypothetical protein
MLALERAKGLEGGLFRDIQARAHEKIAIKGYKCDNKKN